MTYIVILMSFQTFSSIKGLFTWSFFNPGHELSLVDWAENINNYMNDFTPGLKSAKV